MSSRHRRSSDVRAPTPSTPDGRAQAWKTQDGMRLRGECNGHARTHPGRQWDARCPDGWEGYPLRVAWREAVATDVKTDRETTARVHLATEMLLIACLGAIVSTVPAHWENVDVAETAAEARSEAQSANRYREQQFTEDSNE